MDDSATILSMGRFYNNLLTRKPPKAFELTSQYSQAHKMSLAGRC
jgi:hypothetical protein